MQDELSAICRRKEILTERRNKDEGAQAGDEEGGNKSYSGGNEPCEQGRVGSTDCFEEPLETSVETGKKTGGFVAALLPGLQQVHGQRGYQRTGQDVRCDHRKDDRISERDKEVSG